MFRNIIYSACCVVALLGGTTVVEGVKGMKMEHVRITEPKQFFQITKEQAENIKSIDFDRIPIGMDFNVHFFRIMPSEIGRITFDGVHLISPSTLSNLLAGYAVTSLVIKGTPLTLNDVRLILVRIDPHSIRNISLIDNGLSGNGSKLAMLIAEAVYGKMCLDELNIRGNGLSKTSLDCLSTSDTPSVHKIIVE